MACGGVEGHRKKVNHIRAFLNLRSYGISFSDAVLIAENYTPEQVNELIQEAEKYRELEDIRFKLSIAEVLDSHFMGRSTKTHGKYVRYKRNLAERREELLKPEEATVWDKLREGLKNRQKPKAFWRRLKRGA